MNSSTKMASLNHEIQCIKTSTLVNWSVFVNCYVKGKHELYQYMFSTFVQCPWREATQTYTHWSGLIPLLDVALRSLRSPLFARPHFPFLSATGSQPCRASESLIFFMSVLRKRGAWDGTHKQNLTDEVLFLCVWMLFIFTHTDCTHSSIFGRSRVFGQSIIFAWLSH